MKKQLVKSQEVQTDISLPPIFLENNDKKTRKKIYSMFCEAPSVVTHCAHFQSLPNVNKLSPSVAMAPTSKFYDTEESIDESVHSSDSGKMMVDDNKVNGNKRKSDLEKMEKTSEDDASTLNLSAASDCDVVEISDQKPDHEYCDLLLEELNKRRLQREKKQFLLEKTFEELINTEVQYIGSLHAMIEDYMRPITNYFAEVKHNSLPQMMQITVENMHEKNKEFLSQLLKYDKRYEKVTMIFERNAEMFAIYPTYVTYYKHYLNILDQNANVREFVKGLENGNSDKLGLRSGLLKPIQRLSKYQLLLENIQSYSQHKVQRALELVVKILMRCNTISTLQSVKQHGLNWKQTGNALLVLDEDAKLLNEGHQPVRVILFERIIILASKKSKFNSANSSGGSKTSLTADEEAADVLYYKTALGMHRIRKYGDAESRILILEDYESGKTLKAPLKWKLKLSQDNYRKLDKCIDDLLWQQLEDQKRLSRRK